MKRFLLIILTILYIGVSSGITLTLHHCMGKLVDIEWGQDASCEQCGSKKQTHACCSTETRLIKLGNDQNTSPLHDFKYVPVAIALLFDLRDYYFYSLSETNQILSPGFRYEDPPEYSGAELLIRNCTLLI